jgi:hypothetical protein
MDPDQAKSAEIAKRYFGITTPPTRLGWGIGGYVYLSPDMHSVVKVHRREEGFTRELEAYQRLRRLRIIQLHGLTIPKLKHHRRDLKLIRMDFVVAPYLLDFAGVSFDPPDFSEETMENWHTGVNEMFGPNAHIAYAVYDSLARHGIYYMDFRPSNLNLTGLPGVEPFDPSAADDL